MIDLHTHSSASDGTDRPMVLVQRAVDRGLTVVALTDHDTTAGWDEAREAASTRPIQLVCGVEISARIDAGGVHILGYEPDRTSGPLDDLLVRIRSTRESRLSTMLARLEAQGLGVPVSFFADQLAAGVPVGRPHVADALVVLGHAENRSDAIARWLRRGAPAYAERWAPDPLEAVSCIHEAGGFAVLAHPWGRTSRSAITAEFIAALTTAGLSGLEIDHPDHSPEDRTSLRRIAAELGLVPTGGSDYHGAGKTTALGENTTARSAFHRISRR